MKIGVIGLGVVGTTIKCVMKFYHKKVKCYDKYKESDSFEDVCKMDVIFIAVPTNEKKTILCVSRIEKYKNIHYIIEALPLLPSFVQLRIVGRGPFKPELERLIKSLHLEERMIFCQDLTEREMLNCYASADVGVLLSSHESYGLFVAEALASGMPCVVADKDALSEWIDGKNCIRVNYPIKVKEVAHAILSVLDGRVADVKLPTLSDYVKKLQSLYNEICSN
jgi:glycosyltransferase involved in cell wall biosynthesis